MLNDQNKEDPVVVFECSIICQEDIDKFLEFYMKETNGTIKLKVKKKDKKKSIYKIKSSYRCHRDFRYENTRDAESILRKDP